MKIVELRGKTVGGEVEVSAREVAPRPICLWPQDLMERRAPFDSEFWASEQAKAEKIMDIMVQASKAMGFEHLDTARLGIEYFRGSRVVWFWNGWRGTVVCLDNRGRIHIAFGGDNRCGIAIPRRELRQFQLEKPCD